MKKRILFLVVMLAAALCVFAKPKKEFEIIDQAIPQRETYVMYIEDYDWGAGISKFVIQTKKEVQSSAIKASDFKIEIAAKLKTDSIRLFTLKRKKPPVENAYLCDARGKRTEAQKGCYIALEIQASEKNKDTQPFNNTMVVDMDEIGKVEIENDELDIEIEDCAGIVNEKAALFKKGFVMYDFGDKKGEQKMQYAYFLPKNAESKKIPLIVWFHAIGEGGTNPYLPLFGQRAVNLAMPEIQGHFKNGAAVLAPLCPTGFLELSKTDRFGNRIWAPVDKTNEKCVSYYTDVVMKTIDEFIAKNPCIDSSRIYLGGASAGGYMVLNMLLEFPGRFAAGFAASEAYPDKNIPEEGIAQLADTPLWFVACQDDSTINPEKHSLATHSRLQAFGAKDLHLTFYRTVTVGETEYDAHYAWIYLFRDEVKDGQLNFFDWLAAISN